MPLHPGRHGPALIQLLTARLCCYNKGMNDNPIAYHITFGTYGTRLHGDPKGTVDRSMNHYGDPIIGSDPKRWLRETRLLKFPPVIFNLSQRQYAESVIPLICQTGVWFYHIAAAGEDHVHVLLTADADGAAVRKWFKRWLGEKLSKKWPFSTGQSYWSEGGSVKWVWKEDYFHNIFNYISHQRATP